MTTCQKFVGSSQMIPLYQHLVVLVNARYSAVWNHRGKVIEITAILGLALIDCSASEETIGVLKQAVSVGCCIVLANKKPLTSSMEDFDKLVAHPRCIRHESTAHWGL
ncbi:Homoserine dehydrogenase [Quillaja saponaria]|uniref:Homoserine dehydrogenase n=1 Tax=Quillaja saponaria TaxID=32244 RepID=A0AAD7PLW0_QUISA|nr:Homoserine dehydrogenase [Quillaja saponaria]